ncbi:MAG: FAD-dependent oxidoreductase [Steroidobacteraceae bacterium]
MTGREERVFIAGAGPVGLTAAASLTKAGVPVTVLEAGQHLSKESRASTFHPPTLDMLDAMGAAQPLMAQGLKAPEFQFRSKLHGVIAQFDFGAISDVTSHAFRVQSEQFKLTHILMEELSRHSNFRIEFGSRVVGVEGQDHGVTVAVERTGRVVKREAPWIIGADGANSAVRQSLNIEFEGFTWPERFLVLSTPFDFREVFPDLVSVNYVADPEQWHFLLKVPELWRVMFPVPQTVFDDEAKTQAFAYGLLRSIVAGIGRPELVHCTLYRVHQRVAKTFRLGRAFLAGDAAHINNPLGGMGMNGGIHDALNISARLARAWHQQDREDELDRYDRQRRQVTLEYIQRHTIQNKRDLEAPDEDVHAAFCARMRDIASDPARAREYLLQVSMIASLQRAAELG